MNSVYDNLDLFKQFLDLVENHFGDHCENMFDKSVCELTKDEKLEILSYLDSKGAFLITKSGDKVCDFSYYI